MFGFFLFQVYGRRFLYHCVYSILVSLLAQVVLDNSTSLMPAKNMS